MTRNAYLFVVSYIIFLRGNELLKHFFFSPLQMQNEGKVICFQGMLGTKVKVNLSNLWLSIAF